jgi:hypothetical protein
VHYRYLIVLHHLLHPVPKVYHFYYQLLDYFDIGNYLRLLDQHVEVPLELIRYDLLVVVVGHD